MVSEFIFAMCIDDERSHFLQKVNDDPRLHEKVVELWTLYMLIYGEEHNEVERKGKRNEKFIARKAKDSGT